MAEASDAVLALLVEGVPDDSEDLIRLVARDESAVAPVFKERRSPSFLGLCADSATRQRGEKEASAAEATAGRRAGGEQEGSQCHSTSLSSNLRMPPPQPSRKPRRPAWVNGAVDNGVSEVETAVGKEKNRSERFVRLYLDASVRAKRREDVAQAFAAEAEKTTRAACTFQPNLSQKLENIDDGQGGDESNKAHSVKRFASEGNGRFVRRVTEWAQKRAQRLQRLRQGKAQEVALDERQIDWKMNSFSRKLVAQKAAETTALLSSSIESSTACGFCVSAKGHRAQRGAQTVPSFTPTTNASAKWAEQQFSTTTHANDSLNVRGLSPFAGDSAAHSNASDVAENDGKAWTVPPRSVAPRTFDVDEVTHHLAEEDVAQRRKNAEQLGDRYHGDVEYDSVTGQPLFVPNAAPTFSVKEARFPLRQLSAEQRAELHRRLTSNGWGHLFPKGRRGRIDNASALPQSLSRSGSPTATPPTKSRAARGRRSISALLGQMEKRERQAQARLDRLCRAEEESYRRESFRPALARRSRALVGRRARVGEFVPIHRRPLRSAHTRGDAPTESKKGDDRAMERMLRRAATWSSRRERTLRRKQAERDNEQSHRCPFFPKINEGKTAERLAAAAEQRLVADISLLRRQQLALSSASVRPREEGVWSTPKTPSSSEGGKPFYAEFPKRTEGEGVTRSATPPRRKRALSQTPRRCGLRDSRRKWSDAGTTPPRFFEKASSAHGEKKSSSIASTSGAEDALEGCDSDTDVEELNGLLQSWEELDQITDDILQQFSLSEG